MEKAVGKTVWVIQDKAQKEKGGIILPSSGAVIPITGIIFSFGSQVRDADIRKSKGKKAIFYPGVGQKIEYEDKNYLVLHEDHIIGVD